MATLRFFIRTERPDKKGNCPIALMYQIAGSRAILSTKLKIPSCNWDARPAEQRAIWLDKKAARKFSNALKEIECDDINRALLDWKNRVANAEAWFLLNNKEDYTPSDLINRLKEDSRAGKKKRPEPAGQVYKFMDDYIRDHQNSREPGSLVVYRTCKKHLKGFEEKNGYPITFAGMDYAFFNALNNYLIDQGLSNTTVAKQISTLKTFIGYARKHGVKVNESHQDFTVKRERLEVIALTQDELDSLMNLDLSDNPRYAQVRDIFCFSASCGLRVSDLAALGWEHIKSDAIEISIKKTKEPRPLSIPLNAYSASIIAKYRGTARPLPHTGKDYKGEPKMIANQQLNKVLQGWEERTAEGQIKQHPGLCEMAGINTPIEIVRYYGARRVVKVYPKHQLISMHVGRKTFVSLSLEKGLSAEETMSMSGHVSYSSFSRYVHVSQARKKTAMIKAWGAPEPASNLKAV